MLEAIAELGNGPDSLTDPRTIARAIEVGYLDAPHLKGNPYALGVVKTKMLDGACMAIDEQNRPLGEAERTQRVSFCLP